LVRRAVAAEQDITRLVPGGAATNEIADRLHISSHTVQQHLKLVIWELPSRRAKVSAISGMQQSKPGH
jgi:DNA invertase Pin-like site-specific DNA recombinase